MIGHTLCLPSFKPSELHCLAVNVSVRGCKHRAKCAAPAGLLLQTRASQHFLHLFLLMYSHAFWSEILLLVLQTFHQCSFSVQVTSKLFPASPQRVYDRFQVNSSSSCAASSSSSIPALLCSGLVLLATAALLLWSDPALPAQPLWWVAPPLRTSPLGSALRNSATALKNSSTTEWLQLSLSSSIRSVCSSRVKPQCPPLSVSASRK